MTHHAQTSHSRGRPRCTRHRRGFSLVEILVSILILALGVLGLGALFPAVIRQQRNGTDAVNGILVAESARSLLAGTNWNTGIDPTAPSLAKPASSAQDVWTFLRQGSNALFPFANSTLRDQSVNGAWFVAPVVKSQRVPVGGKNNVVYVPGDMFVGNPSPSPTFNPTLQGVKIDLATRLFPTSGEGDPQYVWDVAFQLDPSDPLNRYDATSNPVPNGRIRAAIFVRRVDPGIRVPPGLTLSGLFFDTSGQVSAAQARLPLGEMPDGTPTFDGTGGESTSSGSTLQYSTIKTTSMVFVYNPKSTNFNRHDRLYIPKSAGGSPPPTRQLASYNPTDYIQQIGQKIVDNLGNVYEVIDYGTESVSGADYVTVNPPVPSNVTQDQASISPTQPNMSATSHPAIFSVAYTPQLPVAVRVVEIQP